MELYREFLLAWGIAWVIVGLVGLATCLIFAFLCRQLADTKGRDPAAWFLIGLFTGFVGFIVLRLMPDGGPSCPRCQETLKPGAEYCRFCQYEFSREGACLDIIGDEGSRVRNFLIMVIPLWIVILVILAIWL